MPPAILSRLSQITATGSAKVRERFRLDRTCFVLTKVRRPVFRDRSYFPRRQPDAADLRPRFSRTEVRAERGVGTIEDSIRPDLADAFSDDGRPISRIARMCDGGEVKPQVARRRVSFRKGFGKDVEYGIHLRVVITRTRASHV